MQKTETSGLVNEKKRIVAHIYNSQISTIL